MKNDIDALLDSIFSNGKLRLNNAVRNTPEETGSAAEALQKNMDEIAALNENVRAELEKMDRQIQADGLSESANQKKKGYGEAPSSHSPARAWHLHTNGWPHTWRSHPSYIGAHQTRCASHTSSRSAMHAKRPHRAHRKPSEIHARWESAGGAHAAPTLRTARPQRRAARTNHCARRPTQDITYAS